MAEQEIGSERQMAVKAYRWGARIASTRDGASWRADVRRKVEEDALIVHTLQRPTQEEAEEAARKWVSRAAELQVAEWMLEHKSADAVLRMLGNGDYWEAVLKAMAQDAEDKHLDRSIDPAPSSLKGKHW